jgi:hypothetical protein
MLAEPLVALLPGITVVAQRITVVPVHLRLLTSAVEIAADTERSHRAACADADRIEIRHGAVASEVTVPLVELMG